MRQPMILVVDDDIDVLQAHVHMLTVRGFKVLAATDGAAAIAICHQHQGQIDAVVADLSIPGDNSGFTRTIAVEFPDTKIIYATGIPRHIALSSGLVQPGAPYLEKPIDPDMLANLLRGQIASSSRTAAPGSAGRQTS